MQLREMRYARIEGTEVLVQVNSPTEAKAAIKELRHRKKELGLLKRRMLREQKLARADLEKVERKHARAAKRGGLRGMVARVGHVLASREPVRELAAVEADLKQTEEILHNIDSCIIQIEGRLLT